MTIKQKIWSIPLITILIFSVGMAVTYKSTSYIYNLLQNTSAIHYPYLKRVQSLADNLESIQEVFLDALESGSSLAISRARHKADDFRATALDLAKIDGKNERSQEILAQFNHYFSSAESAASILIGFKKGSSTAVMEQMIVSLNKLKKTLDHERQEANLSVEQSLGDSKINIQKILWASLASVFIVLMGLVYISNRLIISILTSLDNLRTGARKIAQGDFTARIPEQGRDELALVVQSFNSMGEELQEATGKHIHYEKQLESLNRELEEHVATRTAELEAALAEARKANETVAFMADHDVLTGLLGRRRFREEFERWGKYALRYDRSMALMFIDLDKFKTINDTYGHLGGDEYLLGVADILKKTLRATDYIGRWGGDEFAAMLPETASAAACEVASKLVNIFSTQSIMVAGNALHASASIGIAVFPEHSANTEELTALADAAMYKAKNAGRGCFSLYSQSEQEVQHLGEYARWAGRIRRALETDQFILFYQPLLNLKSGESSEYEALLRMEDQDGKFINPGMFLASAERFDLIISIDRMVIRKAAQKIATFKARNIKLRLSLNLSAQFLDDAGIIEYIRDVITEFEIDSACLSFEISETTILQNMHRVRELSAEISRMGCRFILDDIGVGFSSFDYLAPLSISLIKIRGDLIHNLQLPQNHDYLVDLCKTCHQLKINIVAKFVEDLSLLDTLRGIGMDYAQGFAVARPLESLDAIDVS